MTKTKKTEHEAYQARVEAHKARVEAHKAWNEARLDPRNKK